jgi:hypothetical protein
MSIIPVSWSSHCEDRRSQRLSRVAGRFRDRKMGRRAASRGVNRAGPAQDRQTKQKLKGLTALPVPTTMSGPSGPMFPKPLDARLSGSLRLERAKCITRPLPQNIACSVGDSGFRRETFPDFIKIRRGARRALTRTK